MVTPSFENISLVYVVDPTGDTDSIVWELTRELGLAQTRAQVILLDPHGATSKQKLTYRPHPKVVGTLGEAIQASQFSKVAIVDAGYRLTASGWSEIQALDPEMVGVVATYDSQISWTKSFWIWLLALITRWLLGTRKHELARGVTVFRKNQIKHHAEFLPGRDVAGDLVQLLAMTRHQGQLATEIISYQREPANAIHHRSSRDFARRIFRAIRIWFHTIMFPWSHSTIERARPTRRGSRVAKVLGVLTLAAVLLFGAISFPLFEPDESRNAQIAHNIVETGNWMSLQLRGEPYLNKPPLFHWAVAISYLLFGESPWATRLPIALFSLGTVAICLTAGRRIFGFWGAWYGALCLLLTSGFLLVSRYSTMDSLLTMCVTGTTLFGLLSLPGIAGRTTFSRRPALLCSLFAGLGLLAKGPLVLVLTIPVLLLVAQLVKPDQVPLNASLRTLRNRRRWICYLLPAILIAAPWYGWTAWNQPEFLTHFFWKHNVIRFVNGFNHQQPFYFYLVGIFLFMFPVSYLLPSMLRFATSQKEKYSRLRSKELGAMLFVVLWMLLFLSMSSSKLATYVTPIFPLVSLMMGVFLEQSVLRSGVSPSRLIQSLMGRAPFELPVWTLVLLVVGMTFFSLPISQALPIFVVSILFAIVCWSARKSSNPRRAKIRTWVGISGMAAALVITVSSAIFPAIASQRSDQWAMKKLISDQTQSTVVFVARDPFLAASPIGDLDPIYFSNDEIDLADSYLRTNPDALVVVSDENAQRLSNRLSGIVKLEKQNQGRHVFRAQAIVEANQGSIRVADFSDDADVHVK